MAVIGVLIILSLLSIQLVLNLLTNKSKQHDEKVTSNENQQTEDHNKIYISNNIINSNNKPANLEIINLRPIEYHNKIKLSANFITNLSKTEWQLILDGISDEITDELVTRGDLTNEGHLTLIRVKNYLLNLFNDQIQNNIHFISYNFIINKQDLSFLQLILSQVVKYGFDENIEKQGRLRKLMFRINTELFNQDNLFD